MAEGVGFPFPSLPLNEGRTYGQRGEPLAKRQGFKVQRKSKHKISNSRIKMLDSLPGVW